MRWISRTPDQDCLGIVLPATAEPEGYSAEKAKGNVKVLGPGDVQVCMEMGYLFTEARPQSWRRKSAGLVRRRLRNLREIR